MGEWLSCDEQTIEFKGQHKDKAINHLQEGDGFLANALQ